MLSFFYNIYYTFCECDKSLLWLICFEWVNWTQRIYNEQAGWKWKAKNEIVITIFHHIQIATSSVYSTSTYEYMKSVFPYSKAITRHHHDDDIILKIWRACRKNEKWEIYDKLSFFSSAFIFSIVKKTDFVVELKPKKERFIWWQQWKEKKKFNMA